MNEKNFQTLKEIIKREAMITRNLKESVDKGANQENWIVELKQTNEVLGNMLKYIRAPRQTEVKKEFYENKRADEEDIIVKKLPKKSDDEDEDRKNYFLSRDEERLEMEVIKRLKKGEKKAEDKKMRGANIYVKYSSSIFSTTSLKLYKKKMFRNLKKDLVKANLPFLPVSYISTMLFTTLLSFVVSILLFVFLMFFKLSFTWPIISLSGDTFGLRFLKTFWVIFVIPMATFFLMYVYPSMERKSLENKINRELPFVMINMSAISGSMIEPSKIFEIIVSTKEFTNTSREFRKVINEVNVHGYDLVSALRETASNTSSRNLAELLNGLATTITSGGGLPKFFEERAKSFLFEYRLDREKYTRTAETFMDIYISIVIAAPMMLMLLLMMIKLGGIGFGNFSTGMLTLIMVLGVVALNIVFLMFLYLKQPSGS